MTKTPILITFIQDGIESTFSTSIRQENEFPSWKGRSKTVTDNIMLYLENPKYATKKNY